jgi:hypothetical protein
MRRGLVDALPPPGFGAHQARLHQNAQNCCEMAG